MVGEDEAGEDEDVDVVVGEDEAGKDAGVDVVVEDDVTGHSVASKVRDVWQT